MSRFRPGIMPTLVVMALLPVLVSLGFWQLSRAEQKRVLLTRYAERQQAAPLTVNQLIATAEPVFRRVQLRGHLDAKHSLLLDNRIRDGQPGVELLQPFQDQASGQWVLLNRGWLPWPNRRTPPVFSTPQNILDVLGWVYESPGAVFQLQADPLAAPWREGFADEVRIAPGAAAYLADWPLLSTGMGPEKHTAYAVQWFAMALALLGLYGYFGWYHAQEKAHGKRHQSL